MTCRAMAQLLSTRESLRRAAVPTAPAQETAFAGFLLKKLETAFPSEGRSCSMLKQLTSSAPHGPQVVGTQVMSDPR